MNWTLDWSLGKSLNWSLNCSRDWSLDEPRLEYGLEYGLESERVWTGVWTPPPLQRCKKTPIRHSEGETSLFCKCEAELLRLHSCSSSSTWHHMKSILLFCPTYSSSFSYLAAQNLSSHPKPPAGAPGSGLMWGQLMLGGAEHPGSQPPSSELRFCKWRRWGGNWEWPSQPWTTFELVFFCFPSTWTSLSCLTV